MRLSKRVIGVEPNDRYEGSVSASRDAIPSIDHPAFGTRYFGDPTDEVIVIDGDPPRAYPFRILSYQEIVNDEVEDRPIPVTWCPICWSATVYDRRIDGRTLTFGVSGKLADDALVMDDRETESEWKQPARGGNRWRA